MPTIVKIGYQDFLVKNDAIVLAAMKAMVGAIALESTYENGREIYWPSERPAKFSVESISSEQLFRSDPREAKPIVETRRMLPNA